MEVYNLYQAVKSVPVLDISEKTTAEEADAAVGILGEFNQCTLNVMRFSGQTPWERHPHGDELLQVLEGAVEVTVLNETESVTKTLTAGAVSVIPRGFWHRQFAAKTVTMLFATPRPSDVSLAEDPRHETSGKE